MPTQPQKSIVRNFFAFLLLPFYVSLAVLVDVASELFVYPGAIAVAQSPDELRAVADKLERQGIQSLQAGQVQDTIQAWQQALAIYQQLQDYKQAGRLLENFGVLFLQLKEYQQAIEVLKTSLAIAQALQNQQSQESVLLKLAQAHRDSKNYSEATSAYQQALALARELGDLEGQISALGNLGEIAYNLQNYTLAIASYTEAWKLTQKLQDPSKEIVALKAIADTYYLMGNCEYAQAFYEWGLDLAQKSGDRQQQLGLLENHGNAAYCLGKFELALKSYQQGLALAKEFNDLATQGELIGNIGLVNVHLGNYKQAIDFLQQDLGIARKLGRRNIEGQTLGSLGDAYYFQGDYQKALEFYQQSLAIAQEVNYSRGVGLMLTNIGAALLKLQQFPEAEKNLKQGIETLTAIRERVGEQEETKLSIFEREKRTYRLLQEALLGQNKVEEALEIAEKGRARVFLEVLARKSSAPVNLQSPSIKDLKKIAAEQQATLVEYSVIYEKEENKDKEAKLYIWTIQPTGKIAFKQVDLAAQKISLQNAIDNTRESIGVRGRGGLVVAVAEPGTRQPTSLQTLYQLLIEPIADALPTAANARVIFVPQEELFFVPFAALLDRNNTYLIDKYNLLTEPSLQVLQVTRQPSNNAQGKLSPALVVGNPTMPSIKAAPGDKPEPLDSLPGAEQEAIAIAKLLNTQAITGANATKATVVQKMQQSQVVHLATHGLLDISSDGTLNSNRAGFADNGAIALAPQGTDSGLLTVDEILGLKLKADLVVLSACDTAKGKLTGDGVIGLSRSLMTAGAASVVVSLWSIPDAPTAELMTEFYRQLQQAPDKATALRQAMLKTKATYPNPRDWAAFTLLGQPE